MAGFIRRYDTDPGLEVLTEIEGVDIIDRDPPPGVVGLGSGNVIFVGEFENGPFVTPSEVTSGVDLIARFGTFGYPKGGLVGVDPCARRRYADSAVTPEYWNGNGAVHLRGKAFRRLIICRVDTSNGTVQFTRLASVKGTPKTRWNLETGQTLVIIVDVTTSTATFTGVAATVIEGSAGSYAMAAGDTLTLAYDSGAQFTTVFTAADTTLAAVVARINQYAGQTIAAISAAKLRLTGIQRGTGGNVNVVSGSAGVLPTKINLPVAVTAGTGNVANLDQVTFTEQKTIIEAAASGTRVEQLADLTPRIVNTVTPGTGTIQVTSASTALDFGYSNDAVSAATGTAGTIPAGTEVFDTASSTKRYLVMQDVPVTAATATGYSVKIRFKTDDGSGVGSSAAAITSIADLPTFDAFAVTNLLATDTVAKTEAAIDSLYEAALEATRNINSDAAEGTIEVSARQSAAVRAKLLDNANVTSRTGLRGRSCHVRPALGTAASVARASGVQGVAYARGDRRIYNYPGLQIRMSEIALRGTGGGLGFTADGLIDVGSDVWAASVRSQLNPEENPGQETNFMDAVVGLESALANVALGLDDYKAFKAAGIMAPRIARGRKFFQSGINSIDPTITSKRNISRRTMADYIQDSLAIKMDGYSKKPATIARRTAARGDIEGFLGQLLSKEVPDLQRIGAFAVSEKGNTAASIAAGVYRYRILVTLLSSMDKIVLDTTIGETVDVTIAEAA